MRRSSWSLGRLFGRSKAKRTRKGQRAAACRKGKDLFFEPLEERALLSINWSGGGGGNNLWSNGANWVGGVAPAAGADIVFTGDAQTNTLNDLSYAFHSITFSSNGFSVAGAPVILTAGITLDTTAANATATIGTAVVLNNAVQVDVAESDATLTISGSISGSNILTKTGAGTLALAGANTYSGGTTIDAGTLKAENNAALPVCGNGLLVNGNDAVLDLNGRSPTVGSVALIDGSLVDNAAAKGTLSADTFIVLNGEISANLGGDGALIKGTIGAVTLSGTNTYTGLTTVCGGGLELEPDAFDAVLNTTGTARGADIEGGHLLFDYGAGASQADTIRTNLSASYVAGNGSLTSGPMYTSTGSADGYGVGYDDTAGTVTVQVALWGDANLDGSVTFADLNVVLANYNQTGKTWSGGDFNYNGTVSFSDLNVVLANYNQSINDLPPQVATIARLGSEATSSNTVQFVAVFSKDVDNVSASDFALADEAAGVADIASVVHYGGSDPYYQVYVVTVENVFGDGTLGLNLKYDAAIEDSDGSALQTTGFTTVDGQQVFVGPEYTTTSPYVWDGGGTDDDQWGTAANWVRDVAPRENMSESVLFTGSTRTSPDLSGTSFRSIEIASDGFTLTGDTGSFTVSNDISVDAGVSDAEIAADVVLGGDVTTDVADADAMLTISGGMSPAAAA